MTEYDIKLSIGHILIEGGNGRLLVDTGSPFSFHESGRLIPVDRVTDFNPMVPGGTFETPIFEFPASFAGRDFPMRAGHLPQWMGAAISLLGAKGVVGMEILCRYPVAIVDGSVWV